MMLSLEGGHELQPWLWNNSTTVRPIPSLVMGMLSVIIVGVSVMLDMESDVMELRLKTRKMFFIVVAVVVMRE